MSVSFSRGAILPSFKRSSSKSIWNIRPDLSTSMGFWLLKYILSYGIRLNFCFTLPTGTLFTKQKPEVRLSDYLKMANRLWLWALVVCQLINPPRSLFTSYDWSLSEPARVWVSFWFIVAFSLTYITVTVCHCDSGVISSCALACERALLFGRAKQASRERHSLARSRETRFPRPDRRAC